MKIEDLPEGTLVADGWEDCLVGMGWRLNTPIAVYDRAKVMAKLMADDLPEEDADEYISFNIEGAYVGEGTPLLVSFDHEDELEEARAYACRLLDRIVGLGKELERARAFPDKEPLAAALREVAFDLDLLPANLTAHPGWYDEPGPDDHLVFDVDQWSEDVATAIHAAKS